MPLARHPLRYAQNVITIPFSHGQVTSTTTIKIWKTSAARGLRIGRVNYINPTGLAANASNYFDIRILAGAAIAAKFSTNTAANGNPATIDGALPANGFVDLALQVAANRVLVPLTELSLALVLTGTQTLPAGSGLIEATLF